MKFYYFVCLLVILWFKATPLRGQILDDSTKLKYSWRTTRYFYGSGLRQAGAMRALHPDTAIMNYHLVEGNAMRAPLFMQDLGNLASPARDLFFRPASRVGVVYDQNVYDYLQYNPENVRYYNTQSPYTLLQYLQAGSGRQKLRAAHSRNITGGLNFGIDYTRLTSEKQIGVRQARDRETDLHAVAVTGSYFSKNKKYVVLANYTHFNLTRDETGGIRPQGTDTVDGSLRQNLLFDYDLEQVRLQNQAQSNQLSNNWHIYQHFGLNTDNTIQAFYIFDRKKQANRFQDNLARTAFKDFYPAAIFWRDTAHYQQRYRLYQHQAGVQAHLPKLFWSASYTRRDFALENRYLLPVGRRHDDILEANLQLGVADSSHIRLVGKYIPGRDFLVSGHFQRRNAALGLQINNYSATMLQTSFRSNNYIWDNNFALTQSIYVYGRLKYKNRWLGIEPFVEFTELKNHVYFGPQAIAMQNTGRNRVLCVGTQLHIDLSRHFSVENHFRYNKVGGADLIRIPAIFANSRWYYHGRLAGGALRLQAGIELTYRQKYYGYGYQPLSQQFYVQNEFELQDAFVADAFLNVNLGKVVVFLKMSNLTQDLFDSQPSNFITPWYPGERRYFGFGLLWQFYD